MEQPPGFPLGSEELRCRLEKSLYGLRQAPRAWHQKLKSALEGMGFEESVADPGLFLLRDESGSVVSYLLVHVDDLIIASKCKRVLASVKEKVASIFRGA